MRATRLQDETHGNPTASVNDVEELTAEIEKVSNSKTVEVKLSTLVPHE